MKLEIKTEQEADILRLYREASPERRSAMVQLVADSVAGMPLRQAAMKYFTATGMSESEAQDRIIAALRPASC